MQTTTKFLCTLLAGCAAEASTSQEESSLSREKVQIELEATKLIIEHNSTDQDTGFQGFVDGEPWKQLEIRDPDGKLMLSIQPRGDLKQLGLTELFFETNEPPNDEVPIAELLEQFPEGDYDFRAKTIEGQCAHGTATLSHSIPAGPVINTPAAGAEVSARDDLVISWSPGGKPVFGDEVKLTHYELIVEKAEPEEHAGFGSETVDIHMPATVTSMRVPHEFLEPDTDYKFEVLAIDEGGAQTITQSTFSTN